MKGTIELKLLKLQRNFKNWGTK